MTIHTCPKCQATLPAAAPQGLCPACLLQAGLGSEAGGAETRPSDSPPAPPPGAALSLEAIRKLFPQLEIIEPLGRGGMGVVYMARQLQLDRLVALKILPTDIARTPGFAERFAREARALAKLSHPNIVAVHDSGQTDGHYYFIMEFVDGANLRQLIAAGKVTPETALAIVPQVCEALQFAHDEGILHRDIKPENILIDKKGRVKIADFGLAKLVDDQAVDHSLTGTHQVMGTPRYMAPEQFESTKTVDHRADIYSLGVVFYEMLTGEIPMGRFAPPSKKVQVDDRIDEVVLRSLEREPAQRYQHVSEIKTDVENVTQHGVMAPPPSPHAIPGIGTSRGAKVQSLEPRLSKCAVAGAICGAAGISAAVIAILNHAGLLRLAGRQPGDLQITLALGLAFLIHALAATILGGLAIGHIKRSRGKLHGLPLAAAAFLAHPLLIVTAGAGFVAAITVAFAVGRGLGGGLGVAEMSIVSLPVALFTGFFVTRLAWRRISGAVPTAGSAGDAKFQSLEAQMQRRGNRALLFLAIGLVAGAVTFVLISNFAFRLGLVHAGEGDLPPRLRLPFFASLLVGVVMSILGTVDGWRAVLSAREPGIPFSTRIRVFVAVAVLPALLAGIAAAAVVDGLVSFVGGLRHWDYSTRSSLWFALAPPAALLAMGWTVRRLWSALFASAISRAAAPLDHRVAEAVTTRIPRWFNARAKWVQSLIQTVLMLVFLIGLFAFMGFSMKASSGPGFSTKAFSLGAPAPWLEIVNESKGFRSMIHPFASSAVLCLLGVAAAIVYEKIRRSRPGFDAERDRRMMRRWWIALGAAAVLLLGLLARVVSAQRASPSPQAAASAQVLPADAAGREANTNRLGATPAR